MWNEQGRKQGGPNFCLVGRNTVSWNFLRADPPLGLHCRSQACPRIAEKLALTPEEGFAYMNTSAHEALPVSPFTLTSLESMEISQEGMLLPQKRYPKQLW